MPAPLFGQAGGQVASTGASVTALWPAPHAANDIGILIVETSGDSATMSTPSGWTPATGSPITDVATTAGTKTHIFWKRATSDAESGVATGALTNHIVAKIVTVTGCITTGTPFNVSTTGTKGTASTTSTIPSITTTLADSLVVWVAGRSVDSASTTAYGAYSNANLTSIGEGTEGGTTNGNGGGFVLAYGTKATTGATGTSTATTLNTSEVYWVAAFIPPPAAITQAAYRFYEDGTEAGSTAVAAQDTGIARSVVSDSNIGLRFRLQETSTSSGLTTDDYTLHYSLNSGTYTQVGAAATTAVCDSYASSNQNTTQTFNSPYIADGQIFTGNGGTLDSAEFYLQKTGTPTGTAYAKIYATTGTPGTNAVPTGAALATSDGVDPASLATTLTMQRFYFTDANRITLTNLTSYAVVVELSGATTANGLRTGLDNTSPSHAGNNVYYNGSWVADAAYDAIFGVYTGTNVAVAPYDSASLTDSGATTNRLTAGTGSFVAGEVAEDATADNVQITGSNFTELLYSLTVLTAGVSDTDTLDFRVLRNAATTTMTYTVTPRITVSKTSSDYTISKSESVTVSESRQAEVTSYVVKSDTTTVTESVERLVSTFVNVSDSTTVSENRQLTAENYINKSDSVTVTESVTPLIPELNVSKSESVTITESLARLSEANISRTESVTITENLLRDIPLNLSVSEAVTVTEYVERLLTPTGTISETAGVTEFVKLDIGVELSRSDTATLTESVARAVESYITKSENVTLSESLQTRTDSFITKSDTATVTESVTTLLPELYKSVSDTVTLTEFTAVAIGAPADLDITKSESITLSEALQRDGIAYIAKAESVTITESITREGTAYLAVSDSTTVTESIARLLTPTNTIADTATVTESIRLEVSYTPYTSDTATISEFIGRVVSSDIRSSDTATVSEAVALSMSVQRATVDTVTVSDSPSVSVAEAAAAVISVADTTTLSDTVQALIPELLVMTADNATVSEATTARTESHIAVTDSTTVSESVSTFESVAISRSDSIVVSESVARAIPLAVSVSESATVTEAFARLLTPTGTIADTVSLTESLQLDVSYSPSVSDSVTATDTTALAVTSDIRPVDTATITESLTLDTSMAAETADSLTVSESLNLVVAEAAGTVIYVSDSAAVTDSAVMLIPELLITESESITVAENTVTRSEANVSLADSVTVGESLITSGTLTISRSEAVTVSESTARALPVTLSVSDTTTLSENFGRLLNPTGTIADIVSVTESTSIVIATAAEGETATEDSTTVTEAVKLVLESNVAATEQALVLESHTGALRFALNGGSSTATATITDIPTPTDNVTLAVWYRLGKDGFNSAISQELVRYKYHRMHVRSNNGVRMRFDETVAHEAADAAGLAAGNYEWHLAVGTYEFTGGTNNTQKIYRNGVLKATVANTALPTTNYGNQVIIGNSGFVGDIGEVRVYKGLLTADDVTALYETGANPSTRPPAAWYRFTEGTGVSSADISGNGLTLTLANINNNVTWIENTMPPRGAVQVDRMDAYTERTTITESASASIYYPVTQSENTTLTESVSVEITPTRSVSESVTISESVQMSVGAARSLTDNVTLTENVSVSAGGLADTDLSVADHATVSDTATVRVAELIVAITENRLTDESGEFLTDESGNYITTEAPTERATLSESLAVTSVLNVTRSDTATVSESVTNTGSTSLSVSDTTTVTEEFSRLLTPTGTIADTVTATESVTVRIEVTRSTSETVTLSDTTTVRLEHNVSKSDTVSVSEAVTVTVGVVGAAQQSRTETVTVSESLSVYVPFLAPVVSDTTALTDTITPELTVGVSVDPSNNAYTIRSVKII